MISPADGGLENLAAATRLVTNDPEVSWVGSFSAAGIGPLHKVIRAYGCCLSTLTRFARPQLQGTRSDGRDFLTDASCCTKFMSTRQRGQKGDLPPVLPVDLTPRAAPLK